MMHINLKGKPVTFALKKLISTLALPLPIGLILILCGITTLFLGLNKDVTKYTLLSGFVIILVFSLKITASCLLNGLQKQYPPLVYPPQNINRIVVLGGGIGGNKSLPPNMTLNAASLSRLIESIRLYKILSKKNENVMLILSGGRVFKSPAIAGQMQNTATLLGVPKNHISLEDGAKDTHEEAIFLQRKLGSQPFILVTSAYHMPRAMALFKSLHMHPIAAPTQFLGYRSNLMKHFLPSASNLLASDTAIHEYLGILWAKLQGQAR